MYKKAIPVDVHKEAAAKFFGVLIEDVTPAQREAGKNRNYLDWYTTRVSLGAALNSKESA